MKEFEIAFLIANTLATTWIFIRWTSNEALVKMMWLGLAICGVVMLASKFGVTFTVK